MVPRPEFCSKIMACFYLWVIIHSIEEARIVNQDDMVTLMMLRNSHQLLYDRCVNNRMRSTVS